MHNKAVKATHEVNAILANKLRAATFNANSIRSRLGIILDWLARSDCDILCLQETKVADDEFPVQPIVDAGLHCVFAGQKSYNGVAIIARREIGSVEVGLGVPQLDEEARIIRADVDGVTVVNTYVPQGVSPDSPRFVYKLEWLRALRDYFSRRFTVDAHVLWMGDMNVACEPIDVYDPEGLWGSVCYHPDAIEALQYAANWGFVDLFRHHHPGEPYAYTFWDYRIPNALKRKMGWRLDYIWASVPLAERCTDCFIDVEPRRADRPSDHTFVVADFAL
jgi:exodeoxyribonuclease-3